MSQERLAEVADLSGGYISLIESGGRGQRPSRDTVIAIAQALGEDPVEFLRAAGRLEPSDESVGQEAFDRLVTSDPRLRADQKRILIGIYRSYVGRQR